MLENSLIGLLGLGVRHLGPSIIFLHTMPRLGQTGFAKELDVTNPITKKSAPSCEISLSVNSSDAVKTASSKAKTKTEIKTSFFSRQRPCVQRPKPLFKTRIT